VVAATTVGDAHTRGEALVESTSRLTRLVDQMLSSARSNSGEINTSETVEIVALAADVARDHGGRAVAKGQELSFETVQDAVVIPGNTELLRELLSRPSEQEVLNLREVDWDCLLLLILFGCMTGLSRCVQGLALRILAVRSWALLARLCWSLCRAIQKSQAP